MCDQTKPHNPLLQFVKGLIRASLTIASTWLWRLRTVADLSLPMNVSSTRFGGIRKAHFMTVLWA